ncbi:hypothetical protein ES703_107522 [subsurface metagenome]
MLILGKLGNKFLESRSCLRWLLPKDVQYGKPLLCLKGIIRTWIVCYDILTYYFSIVEIFIVCIRFHKLKLSRCIRETLSCHYEKH